MSRRKKRSSSSIVFRGRKDNSERVARNWCAELIDLKVDILSLLQSTPAVRAAKKRDTLRCR